MKGIISPYEPSILPPSEHSPEVTLVPCVVNGLTVEGVSPSFSSWDIPADVLFGPGERLIVMPADKHAQAVALGYTEVEVDLWQ